MMPSRPDAGFPKVASQFVLPTMPEKTPWSYLCSFVSLVYLEVSQSQSTYPKKTNAIWQAIVIAHCNLRPRPNRFIFANAMLNA